MLTRRDVLWLVGWCVAVIGRLRRGAAMTTATATLTGGLITDAVRTTDTEGDGLASPDSSVGIYEAAANIITNPNAATNTAGWLGVNATLARITTDAKFGTTCFQLTSTANDFIQLLSSPNVVIGAPVAQERYFFSAWVKPSAGLIGKDCRIQINENGGATATEFTIKVVTLVAGWQHIEMIVPTVLRADRLSLTAYVNVLDTLIGDVVEIGGLMLDKTATTPTPYATTTRAVGRIQVPMSRLQPRQGWMAARIRLNWGDGVPDNAAYLFSWRDSDTSRIDVRWETGRWRCRRTNGSGSEEASVLGVSAADDEVTIIARWNTTGVSISTRGRAFRSADTVVIDDTFERADQAGWGTAPTGGAWSMTGVGAPNASISSGRAIVSPDATVYGTIVLSQAPSRVWCQCTFQPGTPQGIIALLASKSPAVIEEMVHFIAGPISWALQVTESDPAHLVTLLTANYKTSLVLDDATPYEFAMILDGDTAYLELPDGSRRRWQDDRIAAENGRWNTFELFAGTGLGYVSPRFNAVQTEIPTGAIETSGAYIPTIAATTADLGSKDGTTGFLNGDILWYAAGNRRIGNRDAEIIDAVPAAARRSDFPPSAGLRWLWGADDATITSFRPTIALGDTSVIPAYQAGRVPT